MSYGTVVHFVRRTPDYKAKREKPPVGGLLRMVGDDGRIHTMDGSEHGNGCPVAVFVQPGSMSRPAVAAALRLWAPELTAEGQTY